MDSPWSFAALAWTLVMWVVMMVVMMLPAAMGAPVMNARSSL